MGFKDSFVSRDLMFSLGIEETSGRFYLSFPVSNGLVDYEEYYEIDKTSFDLFQADLKVADAFAMTCRRRERDDLLIQKPGVKRGTAI
ncbi:hypothetical protein EWW49_24820 [Pseudomonas syringae]|uniref:hypothetical protein n=1 Tax=Pseudomonas sp. MWU16-30316 TaxID=2878093 RepID=UPI001103A2E1|nr:hypothetical protein [Pseudomonas sp. MWU16-30316]TFZ34350.1 hypothetical protein EWW49_24820 [Pseudomonas syringae]